MPLLDLADHRSRPIGELIAEARVLGIDNAAGLTRQELVFDILLRRLGANEKAYGGGVLETLSDGFGFLRSVEAGFDPGPDDVYVSPSQIRRFNLRTGDHVRGVVRTPKDNERYLALIKIESVNDRAPEVERNKVLFDSLTPVAPTAPLPLAAEGRGSLLARLIDAHLPLARGARLLVEVPAALDPEAAGAVLGDLARSMAAADPGLVVYHLALGARPEDAVAGDVEGVRLLASTFDEPAARHVQLADVLVERVRRLAEGGRDVALVVDSLSTLARAHNEVASGTGRLLHGLVDPAVLWRVRRVFGTGRALAEGGSVTLVAAVRHDPTSPVDALVRDALEPGAHAVLRLDAGLAALGLRPPLDLGGSRGVLPPPGGAFRGDPEGDWRAAVEALPTPEAEPPAAPAAGPT